MQDMTQSFICWTWLVDMWEMIHSRRPVSSVVHSLAFAYIIFIEWVIHIIDMTYLYVGRDSFTCETRHTTTDMIDSYVRHSCRPASSGGAPPHICIHTIHWMSNSYAGHKSFICGTWLIHMWHITLSHDLFICDTHMGRGAPPVAHVNESRSTHERVTHHIYMCQVSASSVLCCSVLQCVAVCCSVLQSVAVQHRSIHIHTSALHCGELQCVAVYCSVLQCVAVCLSVCAAVSIRSFVLFEMRIRFVERHALLPVLISSAHFLETSTHSHLHKHVMWLIHMRDATDSCVWHDAFICVRDTRI